MLAVSLRVSWVLTRRTRTHATGAGSSLAYPGDWPWENRVGKQWTTRPLPLQIRQTQQLRLCLSRCLTYPNFWLWLSSCRVLHLCQRVRLANQSVKKSANASWLFPRLRVTLMILDRSRTLLLTRREGWYWTVTRKLTQRECSVIGFRTKRQRNV